MKLQSNHCYLIWLDGVTTYISVYSRNHLKNKQKTWKSQFRTNNFLCQEFNYNNPTLLPEATANQQLFPIVVQNTNCTRFHNWVFKDQPRSVNKINEEVKSLWIPTLMKYWYIPFGTSCIHCTLKDSVSGEEQKNAYNVHITHQDIG